MRDTFIDPPTNRPENQRWIFFLYDSPISSPHFQKYKNFFNFTSTYRIDSDFPHFYETSSEMEWNLNKNFNSSRDFYSDKSHFAAAIISNCKDSSKRIEYIKNMQNYVSVDIYGKCGKKQLVKNTSFI